MQNVGLAVKPYDQNKFKWPYYDFGQIGEQNLTSKILNIPFEVLFATS